MSETIYTPISRNEALAQGLLRFFTGRPCKHGHISQRITSNSVCLECHNVRGQANHYKHYERIREHKLAKQKLWRDTHKEEVRLQKQEWLRANKAIHQFNSAKRRAMLKRATVEWADPAAILKLYEESTRLTTTTGVPHHVDHIIPLQHDMVCGLHCEANLRVIPAEENWSKHNKFDVTVEIE